MATNLESTLDMEVKGGEEGEGGVEDTLMALGDTWLLTQEADPSGKILIDVLNGFNDMSHL